MSVWISTGAVNHCGLIDFMKCKIILSTNVAVNLEWQYFISQPNKMSTYGITNSFAPFKSAHVTPNWAKKHTIRKKMHYLFAPSSSVHFGLQVKIKKKSGRPHF